MAPGPDTDNGAHPYLALYLDGQAIAHKRPTYNPKSKNVADIIHLLPDSVANQIAAGEVVQRPASVVKELMENAIDAGAKSIDLLIVDAGRTSIQVIDDGKGMSETDARLAFERHATSKITTAEDLFSLTTMGFRGEALPSIAAVAQVTVRTHTADSELGTCLSIEGGHVVSQEADNCPAGTNIMVQNLFYNVPARRKFLKSNQTELSRIIQEFEKVALVNPQVRLTFSHNGTPQVTLPVESLKQRIVSLFGKKMSEQLLGVNVETTLCHISGYVGKPESARKKGALQYFFINGRYMRHPYFHKAVLDAFDQLIPPTEQMPYFLYFQVDPSTIDVNIHPTKTEIKFENEGAIWQILLAAVREALGRFNAVPTIEFDVKGRPVDIPVYNADRKDEHVPSMPRVAYDTSYNPFKEHSNAKKPVPSDWMDLYVPRIPSQDAGKNVLPENASSMPLDNDATPLNLTEVERSAQHYQYRGQYIVTEVRSGLMFINQHRAHARILYNRYREQMKGRPGASQGLLFPELVQLPVSDVPLVEGMQEQLRNLGFDITPLGGGSYSIQGMPAGLDGISPSSLFQELLDTMKGKGQGVEDDVQHRMALVVARRVAIPSGQILTQQEMENIVEELFQQTTPNYTPDGKVIVAIYPHESLEKMFK